MVVAILINLLQLPQDNNFVIVQQAAAAAEVIQTAKLVAKDAIQCFAAQSELEHIS